MSCASFLNVFLKAFLFILIIGPILAVSVLLTTMAIIANIFTLLYFVLLGWFCEVEICDCHGRFIVDALKKPWLPLICFIEKIYNFFKTPLIKDYNNNKNIQIHNQTNY